MSCFDVMTDTRVPSVPGCPRIVKVIGKDVTLAWTQPDYCCAAAGISGYLIAYATPDDSMAKHVEVGVTNTAKLNENFSHGQSYVFAVAAKNAVGFGDFSSLSKEVTIPRANGNNIFLSQKVFFVL